MQNEHIQELDKFSDNPRCSPEVEAAIERNQSTQFREDYPDYYPTPKNWGYISGWLRSMVAPVTRRNLAIAYELLKSKGLMETNDGPELTYRTIKPTKAEQGIQKVYAEPKKNFSHEGLAENELLREKPERRNELASKVLNKRAEEDTANRALSPIGQPVSQELKAKFRQSLGNLSTVRTGRGNARAVVSSWIEENNLNIKTDSQEYNKLVAEFMRDE